MNDTIMRLLGFSKCLSAINMHRCAWCERSINLDTEFRDNVSKLEYAISGFCQSCQDKFYRVYPNG